MAIDIRPYGRLPVLAVWCFWGTCFYSFLTYQMYGERGRRNRVREYVKNIRCLGGNPVHYRIESLSLNMKIELGVIKDY